MSKYFFVCPDDEGLFERLRGEALVIEVDRLDDLSTLRQRTEPRQIHVHCTIARTSSPVAGIVFREEWAELPLAIHAPAVGRMAKLVGQLPLLRKMNVRFYLPGDDGENYAGIRMLSSLGIETAVLLARQGTDWEAAADLMTYALLGPCKHARIEPFHYIADHYQQHARNEWGAVHFDDPTRYIHVDREGHLALTAAELAAEHFLPLGLHETDRIQSSEEFREHTHHWKARFLEREGCAYCPAWRVCLARCEVGRNGDGGCRSLFTEVMDVVEQYQASRSGRHVVWQP